MSPIVTVNWATIFRFHLYIIGTNWISKEPHHNGKCLAFLSAEDDVGLGARNCDIKRAVICQVGKKSDFLQI